MSLTFGTVEGVVPLDEAVKKATENDEVVPKRKHVRSIILDCWKQNSITALYAELMRRPLDKSAIIAFKSCFVIHSVFLEGPKIVLEESTYKIQWLSSIQSSFAKNPVVEYAYLVSEYAKFLLLKINFHRYHPIFEGNLSVEKYLLVEQPETLGFAQVTDKVRTLQQLLEGIFGIQTAVLNDPTDVTRGRAVRVLSDCRTSCFIPVVEESYSIHSLITLFLQKTAARLDSLDPIKSLIDTYYVQYSILREFYLTASTIRSVASVVTVPILAANPPMFLTRQSTGQASTTLTFMNKTTTPTSSTTPSLKGLSISPHSSISPQSNLLPVKLAPPSQNDYLFGPFTSAPSQNQYSDFDPRGSSHITSVPTTSASSTSINDPFAKGLSSQWTSNPPPVQPQPIVGSNSAPSMSASPRENALSVASPAPNLNPNLINSNNGNATNNVHINTTTNNTTTVPQVATAIKSVPTTVSNSNVNNNVVAAPNLVNTISNNNNQNTTVLPHQAPISDASNKPQEPEKTKIITRIITKTITNTEEIARLQGIVQDLETQVVEWNKKNNSLKETLAVSDNSITELMNSRNEIQQQGAKDALEVEEMKDKNLELKQQIRDVKESIATEQRERIFNELQNKAKSLEMNVSQLDSPLNLGTQDSTPEMLLISIEKLKSNALSLFNIVDQSHENTSSQSQQALYLNAANILGSTKEVLDNAKGLSRHEFLLGVESNLSLSSIPKPFSNILIEASHTVGGKAVSLLSVVGQLGGVCQDESEKKFLKENWYALDSGLEQLTQLAKEAEKSIIDEKAKAERLKLEQERKQKELEESTLNLDDLAERELMNAARSIEEAARKLMAAKKEKAAPKAGAQHIEDISDAIYEAALAIAESTAKLVTVSAEAQRERIKQGYSTDSTAIHYKADPTWAEGLISAARAVAGATSALVNIANDAVLQKGRFDPVSGTGGAEEALLAVSMAVGASTSQLVAAARAKSTLGSLTSVKLGEAAKGVSSATNLLFSAAKTAGMWEEKDAEPLPDYSKMNPMMFKVKTHEQQTVVLRLERELNEARKALLNLRKETYNNPTSM